MNNSKITFEYIQSSANIASVADCYNLSKASVTAALLEFLNTHPESSWYSKIYTKLRLEITRLFLNCSICARDFAEEYGMKEYEFIRFMVAIIDDETLVAYDSLADKLYKKLLFNRTSLGIYTPKRMIRIIAEFYVSNPCITQNSIAWRYGISRCSVSTLLNRGIEHNILSNELATKVASKACHRQKNYVLTRHY